MFNAASFSRLWCPIISYWDASGQRRAAEADLANARAVEQAAEARLEHGLATLPDVLKARSTSAQAEYDLQATIGSEEVASGDLATALMALPSSIFHVQDMESLRVFDALSEPANDLIARALARVRICWRGWRMCWG